MLQDDVAQARALALNAQAAFRQQALIDALARAPEAVALRLLDGSRQRDADTPPQLPGVYVPVRAEPPAGTRVQPVTGGDALRVQTQR